MHSQSGNERTLQQLWSVADRSERGPQPRFTVREVTAVACQLADVGGLSSVSLSKVAGVLELTTTALYRYVDSKEALIELMLDQTIGPPPALTHGDWRRAAQVWVHGLWTRYVRHRWISEVQISGMPRHPNRLHWMNSILLILDRGAVADPMHIALLLDAIARAFAALVPEAQENSPPPDWLTSTIQDRFPRVARELNRDWTDVDDALTRAVDLLLTTADNHAEQ